MHFKVCNEEYKPLELCMNSSDISKLDKIILEGLTPIRENVSCRVSNTLEESFIYLYENRNSETREIRIITENFVQLYNQTLNIFQKHGMQELLQEILPYYKGQKLSNLVRGLPMEMSMFAKAGLDYKVFKAYGELLDANLAETIELAQSGKLTMNMLKIPDNCGYLGSHNGNSWDLFRGFLSGAVLVANAVCTLPTAGLAATSVVVGAVGLGASVMG